MTLLASLCVLAQLAGTTKGPTPAPYELLELRRALPALARRPTLADLDGDGAPEVIVTDGLVTDAHADPSILRNDGDGTFSLAEESLEAEKPLDDHAFGGADLDRDGREDFLVGGAVFLARARGAPRHVASLPVRTRVRQVLFPDLDGDGDPDLIVVDASRTTLWRNDGGASFAPLAPAMASTAVVRAADLDGDGRVDLLRQGSSTLQLLLDDGSYQFVPAPFPTVSPHGFEVGDVDGDGRPDVLASTGTFPSFQLRLFRNLGGGSFEEVPGAFPAVTRLFEIRIADFDGDGDADVLSLRGRALLRNDGAAGFADVTSGLPGVSGSNLVVRDVDRDRDLDLVFEGANSRVQLLLNDGSGRFLEPWRDTVLESLPASPLALADLDGDGDLDLVASNGVRRNDGTGRFEPAAELLDAPVRARDVALGDVDGDGAGDLLFCGDQVSPIRLFLGQEDGFHLAPASAIPATLAPPVSLDLADLDEDGDLDAFLTQGTGGIFGPSFPSAWWRNDGRGAFEDAGTLPGDLVAPRAAAVGDLDGDGHLDVLVGKIGPEALFLGDGAGGFEDASRNLPDAAFDHGTLALALADLDGDGDLDAFLVNGVPGIDQTLPLPDQSLTNDGSGRFTVTASHPTRDIGVSVAAADLDGDGDPDVVVGGSDFATVVPESSATVFYANDGSGRLLAFERRIDARDSSLVAGDLDGDGDVDLVTTRHVLTNTRSALAWRSLPRAGHPLRLELFGAEGEAFVLLASTCARSPVATAFGPLWLDPADAVLAAAGRLGASGRGEERFAVPNELLGATLCWQALLGARARLTNHEPTLFVGY